MHPAASASPTSGQEDTALWTRDVMKAWHKVHVGSRDFTRCQETPGSSSPVKQEKLFMSLSSILGKRTQPFQLKRDPCDERLTSTSAKVNWDK